MIATNTFMSWDTIIQISIILPIVISLFESQFKSGQSTSTTLPSQSLIRGTMHYSESYRSDSNWYGAQKLCVLILEERILACQFVKLR